MLNQKELIIETLNNLGIMNSSQIEDALNTQRKSDKSISKILLEKKIISNQTIGNSLISQLGIQLQNISELNISEKIISKIDSNTAITHRIIPVELDKNILRLITDDVLNFLSLDYLREKIGTELEIVIVTTKEQLDQSLTRFYGKDNTNNQQETFLYTDNAKVESDTNIQGEQAPIIRLVTLVITEAYKRGASDIHIEPMEKDLRIRYRIDGLLYKVPSPPVSLQSSLISRIKIMAGMNIAEKRLPQDGRIKIKIEGNKELDLRVSTLPAMYGESVVLRILDKSSFLLGIKDLGFLPEDICEFEKLIGISNGMILVTGPTGGGKTTTLYATLSHINQRDRKTITVEDPVEYQLDGINQVQVKSQIGLTFANGLRSMLRQAPDIIMVGEIRDYETASIAVQAALTGHLILSTLHTNDAASTVTRLIDMGVKPYLIASTLRGVLAQRLVRKICDNCKEEDKDALLRFNIDTEKGDSKQNNKIFMECRKISNKVKFYKGKGCKFCNGSGYKGRVGIFELLVLNNEIKELIMQRVSSGVIKSKMIKLGMNTLIIDGAKKILQAITTLDEVLRVTQED